MNNIVNDASGNVAIGNNLTVAGTSTITGNETVSGTVAMGSSFKRNRIINGNMQVWQRGTSGFTAVNTSIYAADRFFMFAGVGTNSTASQATSIGLSGFQYAMRAQRNSGNTGTASLVIGQTIETVNCYDLAGKTITVSFWARAGANFSPTGNALTAYLVTGTGTDQGTTAFINSTWTGQAQATMGTATLTTSWQQFIYSVAVPSGTNEIAWYVNCAPTGTAGANDYYDVTGVQLEVGTKATPYEMQIYSDQLAQCQRYYEKSYNQSVVPGTATYVGSVAYSSLSAGYNQVNSYFAVVKRTDATIAIYNPQTGASGSIYGSGATSTAYSVYPSTSSYYLITNGVIANGFYNHQWTASAEL